MTTVFTEQLSAIENILEKSLPQKINAVWQDASFGVLPSGVGEKHIAELIEPTKNLLRLGGKRWRPLLLVLTADAVRTSSPSHLETALSYEKTFEITPLVEFVHTASLIHDDIEDCADERRGKPATHITYGIDCALNAASWLYFEAASCIKNLDITPSAQNEYFSLYAQEMRRLHLGQAMDICWHKSENIFPTQEEYFAMVSLKTGTLSSFATRLGALAGGQDKIFAQKAGSVAAEIGVAFQILDDVKNLTSGNAGKKRGDDIVEGKKSLPVILHLEKNPDDKKVLAELFAQARREGITSGAVEKCIERLSSSGAVQQAKETGLAMIREKSFELKNICSIFDGASDENKNKAELIEKLFLQMGEIYA